MTTRKEFKDQPVRMFVLNAERTATEEVTFRADIDARLDKGMPQYGIPDSWKASVKYEGRTYIVTLIDGVWFYADITPDDDDEDDTENSTPESRNDIN